MTSLITQTGPRYMVAHITLVSHRPNTMNNLIFRLRFFLPFVLLFGLCKSDNNWRILKRLFQELSTVGVQWNGLDSNCHPIRTFYFIDFLLFRFLFLFPFDNSPDARINQAQESCLGAPKSSETKRKTRSQVFEMIIIKRKKKGTLNSPMLDSLNS
jgi:hypothetical protein